VLGYYDVSFVVIVPFSVETIEGADTNTIRKWVSNLKSDLEKDFLKPVFGNAS